MKHESMMKIKQGRIALDTSRNLPGVHNNTLRYLKGNLGRFRMLGKQFRGQFCMNIIGIKKI